MNGDQGVYLLYIVLAIVLVGSALASRRLPAGKSLKLALAWLAIFGFTILLMSFLVES